jgi:hypothetical protein
MIIEFYSNIHQVTRPFNFLPLIQSEVTVGRLPDKADMVIPVATGVGSTCL